ncbi:heme-degrading [compost metagenome]
MNLHPNPGAEVLRLGDPLSLPVAHQSIAAALRHAEARGLRISVAVVDAGGHLLAFSRLPQAPLHTIDIAQDKAMTAVSFSMPTGALGELMSCAPEHVRTCLLLRPRMVPMGGAFPLLVDGRLVGAIGVSGASEEQDTECAAAGCHAIT